MQLKLGKGKSAGLINRARVEGEVEKGDFEGLLGWSPKERISSRSTPTNELGV
jgi:hypothetical protein